MAWSDSKGYWTSREMKEHARHGRSNRERAQRRFEEESWQVASPSLEEGTFESNDLP